jgi:hydrogenase/urease accessory protein HupE
MDCKMKGGRERRKIGGGRLDPENTMNASLQKLPVDRTEPRRVQSSLPPALPAALVFSASIFAASLFVPALFTPPLFAHAMSMSNGELEVSGNTATFELRMPVYEIVHLEDPQPALLNAVRLFSRGEEGERVSGSCESQAQEGWYVCHSKFEFPEPVDVLDVECTLAGATVPNHVHVLKAKRGEVTEQAVFDFSFTRSTIDFVPPTAAEVAFSEIWAGLVRVMGGPIQILFVLALVLAGRSRKELLWLAVAFILAESISTVVINAKAWEPPPRFVEAAAALTVAYLAVEILVLPQAGYRWMVAAGMGVFHGFYFGSFLRQTQMDALFVLTGVALGEGLLLLVFAALLSQLNKLAAALRPVQVGSGLLFLIGISWFILRMRS